MGFADKADFARPNHTCNKCYMPKIKLIHNLQHTVSFVLYIAMCIYYSYSYNLKIIQIHTYTHTHIYICISIRQYTSTIVTLRY